VVTLICFLPSVTHTNNLALHHTLRGDTHLRSSWLHSSSTTPGIPRLAAAVGNVSSRRSLRLRSWWTKQLLPRAIRRAHSPGL
jgi:hypothetical protein